MMGNDLPAVLFQGLRHASQNSTWKWQTRAQMPIRLCMSWGKILAQGACRWWHLTACSKSLSTAPSEASPRPTSAKVGQFFPKLLWRQPCRSKVGIKCMVPCGSKAGTLLLEIRAELWLLSSLSDIFEVVIFKKENYIGLMKFGAIYRESKVILTCLMLKNTKVKEKWIEFRWIKVKIMPSWGEQFISLFSSPKSTS